LFSIDSIRGNGVLMSAPDREALVAAKCVPCEGGVPKLTAEQAAEYCKATPNWQLNDDATTIEHKIKCNTFVDGVKLIDQIAEIAEAQQHHPDLHLTGYRHLKIVLTTHAIGGLSENDFIVAAHIDDIIKEI
jgi:4a-hydroxytetrahydrobiopterin dehydratase